MRVCRVCMTAKALDQFYIHGGDPEYPGYRRRDCKDCVIVRQRQKLLGITEKQYQDLLRKQNGVCAICGMHFTGKRNKRLAVDHDHKTKRIRGLLCTNCNTGIGLLKDNPERLAKAIKYLTEEDIV